jgi:Uma2 family endonuclease
MEFLAMQLTEPTTRTQAPTLLNITDLNLHVTLDEFERLCELNPELRLELTKDGELIAMPPAGYESSEKNLDLSGQVWYWNRQTGLGRVFDSSGGFVLPNGALKSPDTTWFEKSKLADIPAGVKFPMVVPDFVIELRSDTDRLSDAQAKMREYRDNGVRLGWLIDPKEKQVEIYRLGQAVEVLADPKTLSGEDVLPGFTLDLHSIFVA